MSVSVYIVHCTRRCRGLYLESLKTSRTDNASFVPRQLIDGWEGQVVNEAWSPPCAFPACCLRVSSAIKDWCFQPLLNLHPVGRPKKADSYFYKIKSHCQNIALYMQMLSDRIASKNNETRHGFWDPLLLLPLLLLPLGSGRRHIDFLTSAAASTSLLRTSLPTAPPSYMSSTFCQMFSSLINFVIFRSHLPPSCFCPLRQATPFVKFLPVFFPL